ncbi:ELM1/GtrOC1 family putative glycosyltransferase [Marinobacter subterrani]|uniref:Mitochondrial fission protein ELM1 n=1 Tax=Marinobacter subterrani TaxID=1658765 RepID=A0A0J7J6J0_9GAMM|nr:ELM1/GtrOC1 family putative glycosyltransferase [Marinobacter subterrani]KMQ73569.1 Mitochondrial fission protein ELM1 [Marinobacter subterrani]
MEALQALNILILSDGLPGHVNQSRGLVSWLSQRYRCTVSELDVSLRLKPVARLLLPRLLQGRRLGSALAPLFYSGYSPLPRKPDLLISAGGNTSFLNVALARRWQIPNVFLGSKRRFRSDDFAAHLTLEPTGEPHNIVMTIAPTLIDPQQLQKKGNELRELLGLPAAEKLNMLAVGGDGAGYHYDSQSVQQLVQLVIREHDRTGRRWLLTTSRRTGTAFEQQLKQSLPPDLLADSVWWSDAPRKVMAAFMGAADELFITADSMSMIAEAIASARPTVILQPERARPEVRYQEALQRYERAGLCRLATLGQPLSPAVASSGAVMRARETLLDKLIAQLDWVNSERKG